MDPLEWDLRIVAGVIAVISLISGLFLGFWLMFFITMVLLLIGLSILVFTPTGPPGTSAGLGLFFIVAGGFLSLTVPAWIGYGIKLIVLATN